jgi:hypothetical protein
MLVLALLTLVACEKKQPEDDLPRPTAPDVVRKFPLKRVASQDASFDEEWIRDIADPHQRDLHAVSAIKLRGGLWRWQVMVGVMEFIRDVPLETDLRKRIPEALRAVRGVIDVREGDRELWLVSADPDVAGPTLVDAVSGVVDVYAPNTKAEIERSRGE